MRDLVITALVFGALPFFFKRPWLGVLMYAWLSLMNPYRFAFGFAYDFPFVQVVAICTLIGVLVSRDQARLEPSPLLFLMAALLLWTAVTTIFAFEGQLAFEKLVATTKMFFFVFMTAALLRTREQIHWMLWVIVISVGFYGIKGGIFTIATAGTGRVWGPPGKSYLSDNNAIAVALIMVVPLMQYLRDQAKSYWMRQGLLGAMLLCAVAIVGTYSRGGFLAVGVMLAFLWLKSSRKLLAALMVVPLIPLAITFMPERWGARMDTISTYEADTSAMGRIKAWENAIKIANDRPLVGGGFDMYTPATLARYTDDPTANQGAHSVYFQMLGEHGYVGLLIFLSVGVGAWLAAQRTISLSRKRQDCLWAEQLSRAIQVSLVGYGVGGAFISIAFWDLVYYEVVIVVLVHRMARSGGVQALGAARSQPAASAAAVGR